MCRCSKIRPPKSKKIVSWCVSDHYLRTHIFQFLDRVANHWEFQKKAIKNSLGFLQNWIQILIIGWNQCFDLRATRSSLNRSLFKSPLLFMLDVYNSDARKLWSRVTTHAPEAWFLDKRTNVQTQRGYASRSVRAIAGRQHNAPHTCLFTVGGLLLRLTRSTGRTRRLHNLATHEAGQFGECGKKYLKTSRTILDWCCRC
jgi:hypothetical protein